MNITIQQILTLTAVVEQGSIQAGAHFLNKTHPSVITILKKLETELGFSLFDRSGYRSVLTTQGKVFCKHCKHVLQEVDDLKNFAQHLQNNKEPELTIAIGDITPLASALKCLRAFSDENRYVHLNLLFENLEGVNERLLEGKADLIFHHIDKSDIRYEYKDFCKIKIIPVVTRDFLDFPVTENLKFSDLRKYTQCIIRNTATKIPTKDYFVLEHAPYITVGDQYTKKEIIVQGMAWGHMPASLIENELKTGQLISMEGMYIKSNPLDIVMARLQKGNHGIVAEMLWNKF